MKRLRTVGVLWTIAVMAMVLGAISPAQGDITLVPGNVDATFGGTTTFTGSVLLPSGACATTPALGFAADADGTGTGWCRTAANIWDFSANGVRIMNFGGSRLGIVRGPSIVFTNSTTDPNTTASLTITADINTTGSLRMLSGTTPTQSASTCGTGPTIAGNNTLGCVTLGTGPTLPCTIVFNGTRSATPQVFLNPEVLATGTTTVRATGISTTQFVITSTAALVATDKVCWFAPSP